MFDILTLSQIIIQKCASEVKEFAKSVNIKLAKIWTKVWWLLFGPPCMLDVSFNDSYV